MKLTSLSLRSFRNHRESNLKINDQINVFFGKNGQGKTNLLDSIHFLSLTKSFLVSQDSYCIEKDALSFNLEGKFLSDKNLDYNIKVNLNRNSQKEFLVNNNSSYSQLDMIGLIPTVVMTLDDRLITMGAPSDRRKFLDSVLYQISKTYIEDSKKLKRIVKQRNDVLSSGIKQSASTHDLYEAWTDEYLSISIPIIKKRLQFLTEFNKIISQLYQNDFSKFEEPKLFYLFDGEKIDEKTDIGNLLNSARQKYKKAEFERGITLFGPHRDDLLITLDENESRYFSSQGQHKLLLLALKFSMWFYMNEILQEKPIFLIDDIFSELDSERLELISSFLPKLGQTFITATDRENFQSKINAQFFEISGGKIIN